LIYYNLYAPLIGRVLLGLFTKQGGLLTQSSEGFFFVDIGLKS